MAERMLARGKALRPHAKTHKCPVISHLQIEAGAVGVCTAKISEAFVQALAGVPDILVTSPITNVDRVALIAVTNAACADLKIVVDSQQGLKVAELAASQSEVPLGVILDIDVSMGRTGNRSGNALLQLAEQVSRADNLQLRGAQHYAGHLMHVTDFAERRAKSLKSWRAALEFVTQIREAGYTLDIVTGGGTGTFDIDCELDALTDMQVGSYIFMDAEYLAIETGDNQSALPFEVSLTVQACAISEPVGGLVTLDSGYKALASETVPPELLNLAGARFKFAGDEHGVAILQKGTQQPMLGEKFQMITPHCDPTVNLYDYFWVHRDGFAHCLWPVAGRGCVW